jgi:hypothetical protein
MKKIAALIFTLLYGLTCLAQSESQTEPDTSQTKKKLEEPLQLRIRYGEALVRSSFGDRIGRNQEAALAQNGMTFGVVLQAPIFKYLDFTADISSASYDTDGSAIKAAALETAPDFQWEVSTGSYDLRNLFVGLNFYYGNRFRLFFNPSYGVSWLRFPLLRLDGQRVEPDRSITEAYSELRIDNARNMAFSIKGGFDFMITKTVGVHYTLEQIHYDVKSDSNIEFLNVLGERGLAFQEIETTYSTLNHTIGIIVKLH